MTNKYRRIFLLILYKERLDINYAFATDVNGSENTNLGYGHEVMLTIKFGKRFKVINAKLPYLYGLPKTHKENILLYKTYYFKRRVYHL